MSLVATPVAPGVGALAVGLVRDPVARVLVAVVVDVIVGASALSLDASFVKVGKSPQLLGIEASIGPRLHRPSGFVVIRSTTAA